MPLSSSAAAAPRSRRPPPSPPKCLSRHRQIVVVVVAAKDKVVSAICRHGRRRANPAASVLPRQLLPVDGIGDQMRTSRDRLVKRATGDATNRARTIASRTGRVLTWPTRSSTGRHRHRPVRMRMPVGGPAVGKGWTRWRAAAATSSALPTRRARGRRPTTRRRSVTPRSTMRAISGGGTGQVVVGD